MKFGTQLGLRPGHIVLNGDPAPPPQRGTAHNFRPLSVMAKWMDRFLFSFAVNENEQKSIVLLTEKCCDLNLRSKVRTQLR